MNNEKTTTKMYCDNCIKEQGMRYRTTFLSYHRGECDSCKEIAFCVLDVQLIENTETVEKD